MAVRERAVAVPARPVPRGAVSRRFFQRFGTLLILLALCLVFTVIGPWRNRQGPCDVWEQVASLTLVKDGSICQPVFASKVNILNVIRQVSVTGIIAVGQTLVILIGGIDLGVGSIVAFSGVIAAILQRDGYGFLASMLLPLAIGATTGLVVGTLVTKGNMPSFVVTLGVMAGLRGAALLSTDNGLPIRGLKDDFRFIGTGYLDFLPFHGSQLLIPVPILVYVVIIACGNILLRRTSLGRYIYAIGGNENAARLSGINVDAVKTLVFILCGFSASLASLILTARLNSGSPIAGDGYELDVIAGVVIGGTSLSGGRGSVFGTLIGSLLIGVLGNGLVLMNVSAYYQYVIRGAIIVGAVLVDQISRRRNR
ncbi:MAG: ribose ABC transporter permease [Deinococcus sp.]|nr:ribose ABC transporter permease [Deinococcus sp.]